MKKTTKPHPLEWVIIEMAKAGKIIDVSSVAPALCGGILLNSDKGNNAYRIVAADVLGYMAIDGRLIQHGEWANKRKPEQGGPHFSLPNDTPHRRDEGASGAGVG